MTRSVDIIIDGEEEGKTILSVTIGKALRKLGAEVEYAGPFEDLLTDFSLDSTNLSQYKFRLIPRKQRRKA